MRRMRSCNSPATRCTAASAVRPPRITSATRRSQPVIGGDQPIGLQHVARRVASPRPAGARPSDRRGRAASRSAASVSRSSSRVGVVRQQLGRRRCACRAAPTGPIAMPGISVVPANSARDRARPGPRRRLSVGAGAGSISASSIATVSSSSTSSVGVVARRAVLHRQHAKRCGRRGAPARRAWRRRVPRRSPGGRRRPDGFARPAGSSPAPWRRTRPTMPSPTRSRVRPTASRFSPSVAASSSKSPGRSDVDRADLADQFGGDQADEVGQRRRAMRHAGRAARASRRPAARARPRWRRRGAEGGRPTVRSRRPGRRRAPARRRPGRPVPGGCRRSAARR